MVECTGVQFDYHVLHFSTAALNMGKHRLGTSKFLSFFRDLKIHNIFLCRLYDPVTEIVHYGTPLPPILMSSSNSKHKRRQKDQDEASQRGKE